VTLTAKQIIPRVDKDYGEVRWDADVTKQTGESVAEYDVLMLGASARRGDRAPCSVGQMSRAPRHRRITRHWRKTISAVTPKIASVAAAALPKRRNSKAVR
jgi:hypothetical protein